MIILFLFCLFGVYFIQPDTDVIDSETCTNGVLIPSCGSNETIGAPFCRQDLSSPTEEDGKIDYKIKDIECVCCFALCDFESMSQCTDGHLICVDCLNRYTKEAAYGAGKVSVFFSFLLSMIVHQMTFPR